MTWQRPVVRFHPGVPKVVCSGGIKWPIINAGGPSIRGLDACYANPSKMNGNRRRRTEAICGDSFLRKMRSGSTNGGTVRKIETHGLVAQRESARFAIERSRVQFSPGPLWGASMASGLALQADRSQGSIPWRSTPGCAGWQRIGPKAEPRLTPNWCKNEKADGVSWEGNTLGNAAVLHAAEQGRFRPQWNRDRC